MNSVAPDDDALDRVRRRVFWSMPSGLYVVGARDQDRRNGMTLNWATQVSRYPVRLGIAVQKEAFTHELLMAGGAFSLNLLAREDRAVVRKFVRPVDTDLEAGTMNGIAFHDGVSGAPILDQAVGYLDCRIADRVDTGDHTFFVGDVVDGAFLDEREGTDVLRMEDTRMNYGG